MNHLSLDDLGDVDAVSGHPHLAQCPQCRGEVDDQRAVRDLLASLSGPVTAPPDVVSAVDAALREAASTSESASESAASHHAAEPLLGPRGPLREVSTPPSRRRRGAVRAAKVLVGVAAAGLVVTGLGHLPRGGSDTSAGSASAAGATSSAAAESAAPSAGVMSGSQRPPDTALRTGTRYTRAELARQASRLVATTTGGFSSSAPESLKSAASPVSSCLREAGVTGVVQAVDDAAYEGRPATIVIVLVGSGQQVVVLPRDCARQPGAVLTTAMLR